VLLSRHESGRTAILAGFGLLNLIFGKIVRFSRDTTAFIILVIAAAPSLWPRFGLVCLSLALIFGK
jgi:hypothetical protein